MHTDLLPLSHCLMTERPIKTAIAFHSGQYYSQTQFANTVKCWVNKLQAQPYQRFALYTEDAYPFAVLLFALLHAGKEIWLPGNNRPGTAQQLSDDCQLLGDWHSSIDYGLQVTNAIDLTLAPLNPLVKQLVIFTSGATGRAKPIRKCLNQFQLEVAVLEHKWGGQLADAESLATVSHQHIYGLLFRVLWPLYAGRCFHSRVSLNPEAVLNAAGTRAAYWVASPAHLKRLDQQTPWQGIAGLKAIFSSGSALPEASAQQIANLSGQRVIEIYGSSETGGIAWRQQKRSWTLFSGMVLNHAEGEWRLSSPFLPDHDPIRLDDQINLLDDESFIINGRSDRIVKIEEKRLSLTELEQRLLSLSWIDQVHALAISKNRDLVAVVIVLNEQGVQSMANHGRGLLIRRLRKALTPWFESVVLPRKWLFVNTLPLSNLGKIDQMLLINLLDFHNRKLPQLLNLVINNYDAQLTLKVSEDLVYFPDHFVGNPILPGVVQLAWVEHFGKLLFAIDQPFLQMEVVKFIKMIKPGNELTLSLNWHVDTGKLSFKYSASSDVYSSGRMIYKHLALA